MDLPPEILPPDRDEPLGFPGSVVAADILEFERHPGSFFGFALPDPDPLPPPLALQVGFDLIPGEEDRIPKGLEEREGVIVDNDPPDRRLPDVAGILPGLVEDEFHAAPEFFEDGGGFDEDGFSFGEEPGHEGFGDREGDAGDVGHDLVLGTTLY